MKRFIFAHFIALFAFFPQLLSAQTSFGWGSIDVRYSRSEVPTTTKKCPLNLKEAKDLDEMLRYFAPNTYEKDTDSVALLRKANDLLWKLSK